MSFYFAAYSTFGQAEQKQLFFKDPRAGSFTIFGDIPVSHTTGVPDISIPLFTLEAHGYKIPITLKYHLALVKPPYDYTNVATGWVLEAGGTITQEFKTQDDLKGMQPSVIRTDLTPWATDPAERFYIDQVYGKGYDCEHDIFNYSFADKNGKFVIDKTNTQGKWEIIPLTASRLKGSINTVYYPNVPDYSFQNIAIADDQGYNYIFQDKEGLPTGSSATYFLNEIRSPSGAMLFDFDYEYFGGEGLCFALQNVLLQDAKDLPIFYFQGSCVSGQGHLDGTPSILNPQTRIFKDPGKNIKRIVFPTGTLEFNLSSSNRYIEGLVLKDKNNNIIKAVTFEIGHFPGQGYRYLDKVRVKDGLQNNVETYSLAYNESNMSVSNNTLAVDYWGYLCSNAQPQPGGYVPIRSFSFPLSPSYNMGVGTSLEYMQMGPEQNFPIGDGSREPTAMTFVYSLNSIQYPTGGKTEFAYEQNRNDGTPNQYFGGLRVNKITNYARPGLVAWEKRYEYEQAEIDFPTDVAYETTTYNFNFNFVASGCYFLATERSRYFSYKKTPPVSDNRVRYKQVAEYWQNGSEDNGKTIYNYSFPKLNTYEVADNNYFIREQTDHIAGPLLDKKTIYKKVSAGYSKLLEEVCGYDFMETRRIKNLFINSKNFYSGDIGGGIGFYLFDTYGLYPVWDRPGFKPFYYDIVAGACRLTHKTVTDYSGGTPLVAEQQYEYSDGLDKYLTAETVITNKQEARRTTYKYAYAPQYANSFPYNVMLQKNITSEPIEVSTYLVKGSTTTHLLTVKNNYNQFGQDVFRPETVEVAKGNNPLEIRFRYNYDAYVGNLVSSSKENDGKKHYLWGYNKTFPVAEVIGAEYATVTALVNQSVLDNPNSTEQQVKTELDNLRNGLLNSNALVTTYTYKPLIGMTSQTDANGRTTYYEYDAFGRLSLIRDKDNNVLKKFCYNYAGQPEGCSSTPSFGNTTISDYYLSQSCPSGQTPVPYYVTVPTGQFTAASQAEADAAARQYAQSQANQYGGCQAAEVQLSYSNYGGDEVTVELEDVNGNWYFFTLPYGNGSLGFVPPGVYNVYFWPNNYYQYHSYSAGCGYYTSGAYNVAITTVPISNACHNISVY